MNLHEWRFVCTLNIEERALLIARTSMGTSTIITRSATADDYYPVHSCMYSAVCTQQLHSSAPWHSTLDSHSPLPWRGVELWSIMDMRWPRGCSSPTLLVACATTNVVSGVAWWAIATPTSATWGTGDDRPRHVHGPLGVRACPRGAAPPSHPAAVHCMMPCANEHCLPHHHRRPPASPQRPRSTHRLDTHES